MTITIDHDRLARRGMRGDRYVLIDADGQAASMVGYYVQRPAALKNARNGLGVYDLREGVVILEPNLELRIKAWEDKINFYKRQLSEAEGRRRDLETMPVEENQ